MSTSHLTIGLDIDGVVLDFIGSFCKLLSTRHGIGLKYEQVFCHDLSQVLGVPKDTVNRWIEETIEANDFELIGGAKEGLEVICGSHRVVFTTSRPRKYGELTREILTRRGIVVKEIEFVGFLEKHLLPPALAFHIFVDDSVEEALLLRKSVPKVLLFTHPWNINSLNVMGLLRRVYSWQDILQEIEELESGVTSAAKADRSQPERTEK